MLLHLLEPVRSIGPKPHPVGGTTARWFPKVNALRGDRCWGINLAWVVPMAGKPPRQFDRQGASNFIPFPLPSACRCCSKSCIRYNNGSRRNSDCPKDPNQYWHYRVSLWFDPNRDHNDGWLDFCVWHFAGARGVAQPGLARHLGVVEVVGSNPAAPIFLRLCRKKIEIREE